MKRKHTGMILVSLCSLTLIGAAKAEAAPIAKPWPTHAPEATPYVSVYNAEDFPKAEEVVQYASLEDMWGSIYEEFGHFYAKSDELEMFRNLPQDEPFSFVPHSARFELDEGEAMRMARYFDALDGVDARVIAQHTLFEGRDTWDYLTVVTMTPARFFELSEEAGEAFLFEQFYDGVRERFDVDYWPGGLYEQTEEDLKAYEKRSCFYFEDDTLTELEKRARDEVCDFTLREYTPNGWAQDGLALAQVLWAGGIDSDLYIRHDKAESVCVVHLTPAELSFWSEKLPGRYLVKFKEYDETALAGADDILPFGPNREVIPG
ncbi:MAG: hypothetical protein IJ649_10365 [Oscillospiraceae bacterium]|nr:hypothetical protein [Oscillospiraceae bacterium]